MLPGVVRVDVDIFHTSAAREPNEVNVRAEYDQTFAGIDRIMLPIDVDAFDTAVFVFELTEAVPEVIAAANDEEAELTAVLVLPFTTDAIDEEAFATAVVTVPT